MLAQEEMNDSPRKKLRNSNDNRVMNRFKNTVFVSAASSNLMTLEVKTVMKVNTLLLKQC